MRHPTMTSPKVLNTDSLLQDINSLQIRTNAVISASVPNLPKVQRICHLCLEEYGTLKDLQNHISTHNMNHPTTYYSNSTSGSSSSWKFEHLLNIPKASPKHPQSIQIRRLPKNHQSLKLYKFVAQPIKVKLFLKVRWCFTISKISPKYQRKLRHIDIFVFWAGSSRLKSNLYSIKTHYLVYQ